MTNKQMTITHLHLKDGFGNKRTLICRLTEEGYLNYIHYGGWASSGTPHALSNLQCDLPMGKKTPNQTQEEFARWVIKIITLESDCTIEGRVDKVTFN